VHFILRDRLVGTVLENEAAGEFLGAGVGGECEEERGQGESGDDDAGVRLGWGYGKHGFVDCGLFEYAFSIIVWDGFFAKAWLARAVVRFAG
jgi:hypothetical protein